MATTFTPAAYGNQALEYGGGIAKAHVWGDHYDLVALSVDGGKDSWVRSSFANGSNPRGDRVSALRDFPVTATLGFDCKVTDNIRIGLDVADVTTTGFTALLWTWDAREACTFLSMSWVAFRADDPTVRNSFQSTELRRAPVQHRPTKQKPTQHLFDPSPWPRKPDHHLCGPPDSSIAGINDGAQGRARDQRSRPSTVSSTRV
ncbi:hypothetical protein V8E36_009052 [Tilletia maclaganii]